MANKRIYIGYDDRESHFYELCKHSILEHASEPVDIIPLKHKDLRNRGLFTRGWTINGQNGQMSCNVDNRTFSVQFSHTRFLVPELDKILYPKDHDNRHVLFVDCDFIFTGDVILAFKEAEKQGKPVSVVKHNFVPTNTVKMDNIEQTRYEKKLWTAFMFFDVDAETDLTVDYVNHEDGRNLHQFKWLVNGDDDIGSISEGWNFIPDHSEERVAPADIGAVHYTEGGPCLEGYEDCTLAFVYYQAEKKYFALKYLETHQEEFHAARAQLAGIKNAKV